MKFSFGIITAGNPDRIKQISDSIQSQIPEDCYEIIVVGGQPLDLTNLRHLSFDESIKDKWITRKKNMITSEARFENIVYMHDYIKLCPEWYKGFLQFGDDYFLCMNRIINPDGTRYRDWTLWAEDANGLGVPSLSFLLPYEEESLSRYMYFSGAYWVAKKNIMVENPLDESLSWGYGEDVVWSKKVRANYKFSINAMSTVELIVPHGPAFTEISKEDLLSLRNRLGL
jgi:hypothetical protein